MSVHSTAQRDQEATATSHSEDRANRVQVRGCMRLEVGAEKGNQRSCSTHQVRARVRELRLIGPQDKTC
jgi:hypothetical protein